MPCVYCTVGTATLAHSMPELAPHSMKWMRETDGKRRMSSIVRTTGRFTMPWIISRCCAGSIVGMPEWCRSKCRPLGVMIPNRFCSGVKLTDDCGCGVSPGL